jgi:hypothetical protein
MKNQSKKIIAGSLSLVILLTLSACGTPVPLPAPAGQFPGIQLGGVCAPVTGAQPINPSGLPTNANLVGGSSQGSSFSISFSRVTVPTYAGNPAPEQVLGNGTISLQNFNTTYGVLPSSFCIASGDPSSGATSPGIYYAYYGGYIQINLMSLVTIGTDPYAGYNGFPGNYYGYNGYQPGPTSLQQKVIVSLQGYLTQLGTFSGQVGVQSMTYGTSYPTTTGYQIYQTF